MGAGPGLPADHAPHESLVRTKRPVIFAVNLLIQAPNFDRFFFSDGARTIGRQWPPQEGQSVSPAPPTRRT